LTGMTVLFALSVVSVKVVKADVERIDLPFSEAFVYDQKPDLGKTVTATYTIKALKEGLQDIQVHWQTGRIYRNGTERHDILISGVSSMQSQTVAVPNLRKGEAFKSTITLLIPSVEVNKAQRDLWRIGGELDIVTVWATCKTSDGKPAPVRGATGDIAGHTCLGRTRFDFDELPSEANFYLHYFGPTDGSHEEEIAWVRNMERVRVALNLSANGESRAACLHLWQKVEAIASRDKMSQDQAIEQLVKECKGIASTKKLSNYEAAREYLRIHGRKG
jgi:hypothetical protein